MIAMCFVAIHSDVTMVMLTFNPKYINNYDPQTLRLDEIQIFAYSESSDKESRLKKMGIFISDSF